MAKSIRHRVQEADGTQGQIEEMLKAARTCCGLVNVLNLCSDITSVSKDLVLRVVHEICDPLASRKIPRTARSSREFTDPVPDLTPPQRIKAMPAEYTLGDIVGAQILFRCWFNDELLPVDQNTVTMIREAVVEGDSKSLTTARVARARYYESKFIGIIAAAVSQELESFHRELADRLRVLAECIEWIYPVTSFTCLHGEDPPDNIKRLVILPLHFCHLLSFCVASEQCSPLIDMVDRFVFWRGKDSSALLSTAAQAKMLHSLALVTGSRLSWLVDNYIETVLSSDGVESSLNYISLVEWCSLHCQYSEDPEPSGEFSYSRDCVLHTVCANALHIARLAERVVDDGPTLEDLDASCRNLISPGALLDKHVEDGWAKWGIDPDAIVACCNTST